MEATIKTLSKENRELREQLLAAPAKPTRGLAQTIKELMISKKKARIPKPHNYDGERSKLPTFCQEAETYIVDQGLDHDSDTEKVINIIAGYLTGNAATWYTIAYHTPSEIENKWESREEFWKEIKARFGEADPSFAARTRLSKLKQGGKSVQSYSSSFNELATLTGYNDQALVNEYFKGLNTDILQGIFRRDEISTKLEKAIEAATREENIKYMFSSFLGGGEKTMPYQGKKAATANSAAPSAGQKAGNDNRGRGGTMEAKPGMSGPMDVDRTRQSGECWHCGDPYMPGHFCPAKKAAQDAYKTCNRAIATEEQPEALTSREITLSKDAKGKGKEKAQTPDQDIGGTLASMMDMINIITKRLDSLNG